MLEGRPESVESLPQPVSDALAERYAAVRNATLALCDGASPDDCQVQSMADASPVKWHLAHTTWFFETFVLAGRPGYVAYCAEFAALFNSYYNGLGPQYPRAARGLLSRPTLDEVHAYRAHVDGAIQHLLAGSDDEAPRQRIELGLQHEQQHQELILTDLKHALSRNPLLPCYRPQPLPAVRPLAPSRWLERPAGLVEIGHTGAGFAFDNEGPRHRVWLDSYALASRAVTNSEYRAFIEDGGYRQAALWLADGWQIAQAEGWQRPLYWDEDLRRHFTLHGLAPIDDEAPVCHLSYYEADAYARWAGARLPREAEWEAAAAAWPVRGNFVESGRLAPRAEPGGDPEFYGNVWEWTASAYAAYPGYRVPSGLLGEYNGKFMCNQQVLRGGSCASPGSHLRATYRNFFPPHARWQFSGLRLARDVR